MVAKVKVWLEAPVILVLLRVNNHSYWYAWSNICYDLWILYGLSLQPLKSVCFGDHLYYVASWYSVKGSLNVTSAQAIPTCHVNYAQQLSEMTLQPFGSSHSHFFPIGKRLIYTRLCNMTPPCTFTTLNVIAIYFTV